MGNFSYVYYRISKCLCSSNDTNFTPWQTESIFMEENPRFSHPTGGQMVRCVFIALKRSLNNTPTWVLNIFNGIKTIFKRFANMIFACRPPIHRRMNETILISTLVSLPSFRKLISYAINEHQPPFRLWFIPLITYNFSVKPWMWMYRFLAFIIQILYSLVINFSSRLDTDLIK